MLKSRCRFPSSVRGRPGNPAGRSPRGSPAGRTNGGFRGQRRLGATLGARCNSRITVVSKLPSRNSLTNVYAQGALDHGGRKTHDFVHMIGHLEIQTCALP